MESLDDDLIDDLVALRPAQDDTFARALRASVRSRLVGVVDEPFRLGRFTVLGPLGGGGMGVVFIAYDPDLDRKIALKVLRASGDRGRREMLREGRALARLKHPNIVTVYEVGVVSMQVFVAMEYVEGNNLREWLRQPRAAKEILARLVEAGRGLAAAHAAELVHRDVKPENIVIDAQDRARVVDFGLARLLDELPDARRVTPDAAETPVSVHGGTPAYMAPERLAGGPGDRASDQYSFCVTCWEALYGGRPGFERPESVHGVPSWVRRVLARGLSPDPARRWPSMPALLAELEGGRRRARVWRLASAALVVAAVGAAAEGLRRRDIGRRIAACEAAGAEIDATWNDGARQGLRDAFVATGLSYAATSAERAIEQLDEYAAEWEHARTEVCLNADVRGRWDADLQARAVFCLDDQHFELVALVPALGAAGPADVSAPSRLASPEVCLDATLLERQPPQPADRRDVVREIRVMLAKAHSLGFTGDFAEALAFATRARLRIEAELDAQPLWARARALEAFYLEKLGGDYAQSETASAQAYFAAARAGAWKVAADAAVSQVHIIGFRQHRYAEGRAWAAHAEVALAHAGDATGEGEGRRLTALGNVHMSATEYPEARALFERAVGLLEAYFGPDHPLVMPALNGLASAYNALGAYPEARTLFERVLTIVERVYGPDHRNTVTILSNLAIAYRSTGQYEEARAMFERAGAALERTLGTDNLRFAKHLFDRGILATLVGRDQEARSLLERALAIREKVLGPDHPDLVEILNGLAALARAAGAYAEARVFLERALALHAKTGHTDLLGLAGSLATLADVHVETGAHDEALPLYEQALALVEKTLGPENPEVTLILSSLGSLHLDAGRPQQALPPLERAVAVVDTYPGEQPDESRARFLLARALVDTRGDRARALAEARKARDGWRAAGAGQARELAATEQWLAAQGAAE